MAQGRYGKASASWVRLRAKPGSRVARRRHRFDQKAMLHLDIQGAAIVICGYPGGN